MYSGTTFRVKSGRFVGVHQKIDRVARRKLTSHLPAGVDFPDIEAILHFEGKNGPDGIKGKSPGVDEPWHFIDPNQPDDRGLIIMVNDHIDNLAEALTADNSQRAAYEAAWLAHAVVDGLTPAHHYPLSQKIQELWGMPKESRQSVIDKNIIRGKSGRDTIAKNWAYWGAKGIFSTHLLFELGVAASIKTHNFTKLQIEQTDLDRLQKDSFETIFLEAVHEIHNLSMYEDFWKYGWSNRLATKTRRELLPIIIRTVTLAWQLAALKSVAKS